MAHVASPRRSAPCSDGVTIEPQASKETPIIRFSDKLEHWLESPGRHTIAGLSNVFGEKSFAVLFLVLMFVPALPLPTGGITHLFEIINLLLAVELMFGRRTVWLPKRWREATLPASRKITTLMIRRIRWVERLTRPRLAGLLEYRPFIKLVGFSVFLLTLAAFLAPPFSGLDTLPSLGVIIIALALIFEDSILFAVGLLIGLSGIALELALGEVTAALLGRLF